MGKGWIAMNLTEVTGKHERMHVECVRWCKSTVANLPYITSAAAADGVTATDEPYLPEDISEPPPDIKECQAYNLLHLQLFPNANVRVQMPYNEPNMLYVNPIHIGGWDLTHQFDIIVNSTLHGTLYTSVFRFNPIVALENPLVIIDDATITWTTTVTSSTTHPTTTTTTKTTTTTTTATTAITTTEEPTTTTTTTTTEEPTATTPTTPTTSTTTTEEPTTITTVIPTDEATAKIDEKDDITPKHHWGIMLLVLGIGMLLVVVQFIVYVVWQRRKIATMVIRTQDIEQTRNRVFSGASAAVIPANALDEDLLDESEREEDAHILASLTVEQKH
jgi:Na+-transporting methylmalonyl-CoA/oxaloacetate decarboxylase gamma subunit